MAWDDAPPTKQELGAQPSSGSWDQAPPTDSELRSLSKSDAAQAALEHFGNAASLGYLPQIQAATEPVTNKILDFITGNNVSGNDDSTYVQRRDENIARMNQQDKEHPTASLAGTIGGALTGGTALSSLLPIQGATMGARALNAAKTGAIIGAAANPGDEEGVVDPIQAKNRAIDSAGNAVIGFGLQPVAEGVSALGSYLGNKLSSKAEEAAFKALGPYQRNVLQNSDDINSIGRTLLDEGVVKAAPTDYEGLAARAGAAKELSGKNIEGIVDGLAGQESVPSHSRQEIAQSLKERLLADPSIPGVSGKNSRMNALIDEFSNPNVSDAIDLKSGRGLKAALGKQIKWDRLPGADIPLEEEFHRALYSELANGENNIAKALADSGTAGGTALQDAKSQYGNLSEAERIASKRSDKNFANQFLGLKDMIAGGTGAGVGAYLGNQAGGHEGAKYGAMLGAGVGSMGSKMARNYGNQITAVGADALAGILSKSPLLQDAVSKNPALAPALLNAVMDKNIKKPDNAIGRRMLSGGSSK